MFRKTKKTIRKSRKDIEAMAGNRKYQYLCVIVIALLIGVGMSAGGWMQSGAYGQLEGDTTTTTTTDTTTTTTDTTTDTTTTTTTTEPVVIKYIFKARWHLTAPETAPDWVLIEVFTSAGVYRDGIYMFDEATWYGGHYAYEFEGGFQGYIEIRSTTGWSLGLVPLAPKDITAGPWSNSFDIFGDFGGIVGYLLFTWEEV